MRVARLAWRLGVGPWEALGWLEHVLTGVEAADLVDGGRAKDEADSAWIGDETWPLAGGLPGDRRPARFSFLSDGEWP